MKTIWVSLQESLSSLSVLFLSLSCPMSERRYPFPCISFSLTLFHDSFLCVFPFSLICLLLVWVSYYALFFLLYFFLLSHFAHVSVFPLIPFPFFIFSLCAPPSSTLLLPHPLIDPQVPSLIPSLLLFLFMLHNPHLFLH